jgi:ribonuclease HI
VPEVCLYTDGSCIPTNPGPGGWAAILVSGDSSKELFGSVVGMTTNQRMELTAAIEGLSALKRSCEVTVYTDSQYVQKGMTEWMDGWKSSGRLEAGDLSNADLWKRLVSEAEKHSVRWVWVKGHAGNELNTKVDALAHDAARRARDTQTVGNTH